jgi:hypothetical protein
MDTTKVISLRLDPPDFEQLRAEAKRPGVSPGALARTYVQAGLRSGAIARAPRRRAGWEALDQLDALRAELRRDGYPSVGALAILQVSRAELEERPDLP